MGIDLCFILQILTSLKIRQKIRVSDPKYNQSIVKWSHLNNFGRIKVLMGKAVAQRGTNLEDFL